MNPRSDGGEFHSSGGKREQLAESDFKRSIACLQLEVPGAVWDDVKVKSDALLARLRTVEQERDARPTVEDGLMLRGVTDALPETWHAGKPLDVRVRLLVEGWRIATHLANDLDAAEARVEALGAVVYAAREEALPVLEAIAKSTPLRMETQTTTRRFYSVAEVGEILGVSTQTAYNLVRDEGLPVIRLRGLMRIPAGALDEWISAREREALAGAGP